MFGLGLTSVTLYFEKLQIIRCHLLKMSPDKHIAALYNLREVKEQAEKGFKWRATRLFSKVISMVNHQLKYQAADPTDKRGLGHGLYVRSI
jgi:hypothetical protein